MFFKRVSFLGGGFLVWFGFEVLGVDLRVLHILGKFSNPVSYQCFHPRRKLTSGQGACGSGGAVHTGRDEASQASDDNWVSPRDKAAPG